MVLVPLRFLLGLAFSSLIGIVAYRKNTLTASGAAGAILVGTLIVGFGGWAWGMVLIAFFVSSSLLSHYRRADKVAVGDKFAKGHRRDLGQTLANGGLGALLAVGYFVSPNAAMLAAYVGAMATVNSDTWATEIGVLSRQPPRLVTTWRVVPPGTSGGITGDGSLAALGGGGVYWAFCIPLGCRRALGAWSTGRLGGIVAVDSDSRGQWADWRFHR